MSKTESPNQRANTSKWNARYAYAKKDLPQPCDVLTDAVHFLPAKGLALDLACGRGGNAFYLANKSLSVKAWDNSQAAIDWISEYQSTQFADFEIETQVRDVVQHPPESNSFDVIVVSRFLHRDLCVDIADALKPKGLVFYQTFITGLSNADYLLQPGELPTLFPSLNVRYTQESAVNDAGFSEAMFVGEKPANE